MPKDHLLSSSVRVSDYKKFEANKDQSAIAAFFLERFRERYIIPIDKTPKKFKHGFSIMAICCLTIEAVESFWNGWEYTKNGRSQLAFCQFFSRCPRFYAFLGLAHDFYKHVRCGILHQAETTGGWTIIREGPLFDPAGLTINATEFHKMLSLEINDFAKLLEKEDWHSEHWGNFRKKMIALCRNCDSASHL
jgi:hypothetical protein